MCGIGGILRRDGGPIPEEWLNRIDSRIEYRGPDGCGRFRDRVELNGPDGHEVVEVALIHRRLSIIDLADGDQPMVSKSGRDVREGLVAIVFNGCIYNHRELRDELETRGHTFATDHSDTETLIHGYREWGDDLTDHLEGMYAFALWDRTRGALVLARDWFGEKPLYFRGGVDGDQRNVAFASNAQAIAELDPADAGGHPLPWTGQYLQLGYNHRGQSIYQGAGVRQVPPSIVEQADELMPRGSKGGPSLFELEELFDQAVARRLEADVPLGCFLSGGIDSSLIAHFAKQHSPDLQTFCVKMPDPRYDESPHAERVATHLGTNHTTLEPTIDPATDLVKLVETFGQPFGDSSILPTYWVSVAARKHVKVAISGDGGDELFLGYQRYMAARALNRHRRLLQWIPGSWQRGAHPKSRRHKLGRLGDMARDLPALGVTAMESIFTQRQIFELLGQPAPEPVEHLPGWDPMQALRKFDLVSYLPDDLLCKVDTASMMVALEVRAPFLDRDLVRAVLLSPTWRLAPKGKRKEFLKQLARKHLPADIVDRTKMGFAIPIGQWFRDDYGGMKALLLGQLQADRPFGPIPLNRNAIDRLLEEHMTDQYDHSQRLFALLTLSLWARGR